MMGKYPDLNREHTVPHTVTLPLSYIHLNCYYTKNKGFKLKPLIIMLEWVEHSYVNTKNLRLTD